MSIYRFSSPSLLNTVRFRYAKDRPPMAHISAINSDHNRIFTVRRALEAVGLECVPTCVDGQSVLQVTGFKDEGQLVALLITQRFASGTPIVQPEAGDHPTRSWQEWLDASRMKAAGVFNLVGDVGLLVSGLMSKRQGEIVAGGLYTAGALVLTQYGNIKTKHHLNEACIKLGNAMQIQGAELPEECGLFTLVKEQRTGALNDANNFLARYPSQVTLSAYSLGALSMLQSGMKHKKFWDMAYGVNSIGGKVASLLIPEKKKEEGAQKKTNSPIANLFDWIQAKPLRLFGYTSLVSDALLGISAYREYCADPHQRSYFFKFLTTGTYLAADVLIAGANKDHTNAGGKFDAEEQRRIEALAAETIACQPADLREPLTQYVGRFLAAQAEMNGNAQQIADNVRLQVEEMQHNPWACQKARVPHNEVRNLVIATQHDNSLTLQ